MTRPASPAVTDDGTGAGGRRAASPVTAARADDTAGAVAGRQRGRPVGRLHRDRRPGRGTPWVTGPPGTPWREWPGTGTSPAAENGNGGNGFTGFPDYGSEAGWPPPPSRSTRAPRSTTTWIMVTRSSRTRTHCPGGSARPAWPRNCGRTRCTRSRSANGDSTAATETPDERSPEEARSTITAIQRGWERGRSLFDPREKSTETMTGTQPAGGAQSPEAGEARRPGRRVTQGGADECG